MTDLPANLLAPLPVEGRSRKSRAQSSLDGQRNFKAHLHSQGRGKQVCATKIGLEIMKDQEDEDILR